MREHSTLPRQKQDAVQSLMSDYQDDTEISLGAGKLLFLFFGLVILCGGFFGVGYLIGKNSGTPQVAASNAQPATVTTGAAKPSSAIGGNAARSNTPDCATPGNCDQQPADSQPFYDSVGQKDVSPKLEPPAPAQTPAVVEQKAMAPPQAPKSATSVAGTGYVVQVAAVSKQQDADTLVSALRKKQYPVFVTSNPPNDKLFHVQAGPFSDIKEAEAVKARLTNDGYSPMLKR
jgi:DedD protein